jgi:hypothetical protein
MKRVLLAFCCVAFSADAALAEEPLAPFFGNTLVVRDDRGERKMWYKPDHTYSGVDVQSGVTISGTWEIKDNQLCTMRLVPKPEPSYAGWCRPVPAGKKIGDSWDGTNREGLPMSYRLVSGQ